ncbi:MAG: PIN domain-containing protein [Thiohalomonadales bacterium]
MKRYLLDTSALLTLRDNEPGADLVADLLSQAENKKINCFACFMTLMEILYRVWKDEDQPAGRLAYDQVQALPITWIHENQQLLEKSAMLKATHAVSLADAWIAANAILEDAVLVHKDPEFLILDCPQLELPFKK